MTVPETGVFVSKRERNKASNREAILRAARAVFAEMGYGAASVRDIIRRTDLASGTFYNYFPDKQSIFRAIVEEIANGIRLQQGLGRRRATTVEAFIEGSFRGYFNYIAQDPELVALTRRSAGAIRTLFDEPEVMPLFRDLLADIGEAMARGVLPKIDVDLVASAIVGMAFEMAIVMVARDPIDPEATTKFATALLIGGLAGISAKAGAAAS
jgi:AcrR family transcriptional regulator